MGYFVQVFRRRLGFAPKTAWPSIFIRNASTVFNTNQTQVFNFKNDIFEDEPLQKYYGDIGPKQMKLAVRWPYPVPGAKRGEVEPKMYNHGIWPFPKFFTNSQMIDEQETLLERHDLDQMFIKYEKQVLKYWPDLRNPTDLDAAKLFFDKQWERHGLPTGMCATMYLYYGLALRDAIPDSFGIPVGIPMKLKEASEHMKKVMSELQVFGKAIGAPVYPEIYTGFRQIRGAYPINEIRPQFARILVEGKAELRAIDVQNDPNFRNQNKYYSGGTNDQESLVILPTRHQFESQHRLKDINLEIGIDIQ